MRLTLAERAPTESFPALLDRLYREQYTGEVLLCFGQGHPKAAKFIKTTEIRLDRLDSKA